MVMPPYTLGPWIILALHFPYDPLGQEPTMQDVPASGFVGVDGASLGDALDDGLDRIAFVFRDERQGPAITLAHDDDGPALACLVDRKPAVLAIFLAVLRLNVAAKIRAVDLDVAR